MKKILFFITTLGDGGAERVLVDTVNLLNPEKYHITVQTIVDTGGRKNELAPHVQYKSILRMRTNTICYRIAYNVLRKVLPASWSYRLFVKGDYDIEISFMEGLSTKIVSGSCNKKSTKIAWVHTDLMQYFGSVRAFSSIEDNKRAYEQFDKIVGVSQDAVNSFQKRFFWKKDNLFTVYNIYNDGAILKKSLEPVTISKTKDRTTFVSCGRLSSEKGFDRLLRIHRKLLDEGHIHDLWIVGEGAERPKLEQYITENGLEKTVTLLGFQKNPYPYIANADVFVCSSYVEGYSTVVTEACILGLPIISTNVSGASEPQECPRCSVICDNTDDALYEAIKNVLIHPELISQYAEEMKRKGEFFRSNSQIMKLEEFLDKE